MAAMKRSFQNGTVFPVLKKILYLLKFVLFRKVITTRFVSMSLPWRRNQYLFDRRVRKFIKILVHSENEYATFCQIFLRQDYEINGLHRDDVDLAYSKILDQGGVPLIIDVGGNVGYASIYFRLAYPESRIVLLEPSNKNFKLAQQNSKEYAIDCLNVALGPYHGKVSITDPGLGDNALRVSLQEKGEIEMLTVSQILKQYFNTTPFLIKIDIEGFEHELFMGDNSWVEKFPILIIELHDFCFPGKSKSQNFLRTISTLNRDFVYIGENVFSISNNE
jgi:FkbM family methyltransferase